MQKKETLGTDNLSIPPSTRTWESITKSLSEDVFTAIRMLCDLYAQIEKYNSAIALIEKCLNVVVVARSYQQRHIHSVGMNNKDSDNVILDFSLPLDLVVKYGIYLLFVGKYAQARGAFQPLIALTNRTRQIAIHDQGEVDTSTNVQLDISDEHAELVYDVAEAHYTVKNYSVSC